MYELYQLNDPFDINRTLIQRMEKLEWKVGETYILLLMPDLANTRFLYRAFQKIETLLCHS